METASTPAPSAPAKYVRTSETQVLTITLEISVDQVMALLAFADRISKTADFDVLKAREAITTIEAQIRTAAKDLQP